MSGNGGRGPTDSCTYQWCGRRQVARGLCGQHREQLANGDPLRPLGRLVNGPCGVRGCDRRAGKLGLCTHHRARCRDGQAMRPVVAPGPRKLLPNPALPGTLLVPLTRGLFAIIDETDGPAVGRFCWSAVVSENRVVYAKRTVRGPDGRSASDPLHWFLWRTWGLPAAEQIDHEDTDGLNNRRLNLRAASPEQNSWNTRAHRDSKSGIKGVRFQVPLQRWEARICRSGKSVSLGFFDTPIEAAAAYASAARELFGRFARAA